MQCAGPVSTCTLTRAVWLADHLCDLGWMTGWQLICTTDRHDCSLTDTLVDRHGHHCPCKACCSWSFGCILHTWATRVRKSSEALVGGWGGCMCRPCTYGGRGMARWGMGMASMELATAKCRPAGRWVRSSSSLEKHLEWKSCPKQDVKACRRGGVHVRELPDHNDGRHYGELVVAFGATPEIREASGDCWPQTCYEHRDVCDPAWLLGVLVAGSHKCTA